MSILLYKYLKTGIKSAAFRVGIFVILLVWNPIQEILGDIADVDPI